MIDCVEHLDQNGNSIEQAAIDDYLREFAEMTLRGYSKAEIISLIGAMPDFSS